MLLVRFTSAALAAAYAQTPGPCAVLYDRISCAGDHGVQVGIRVTPGGVPGGAALTGQARRPGREGAVEALVEAARALFAERGPDAVSLRDVARRAGVNHGLIRHYIGSRDDLLRLVFAVSTERARRQVEGAHDATDALRALRGLAASSTDYSRLLAWALLEGHDPAQFHGRSSALDTVVKVSGDDSRELRVALAMAMVQTLGWKLFGDYALSAVGLDDEDPDAVRRDAEALVDRLVTDAAGESATVL
jgi:TetR/AcrR family transcriptional regulator, repressor for neighboring sulfatase